MFTNQLALPQYQSFLIFIDMGLRASKAIFVLARKHARNLDLDFNIWF